MVELVDTRDLKSLADIGVRVRVPLGAPQSDGALFENLKRKIKKRKWRLQ